MSLGGYVIRPSTGKSVRWQAAMPVQRDYDWIKDHGLKCYGVIGNEAHLRKSGEHTPWADPDKGYAYGWVHAIDIGMSDAQFSKILSALQSGRWRGIVRYVNYDGKHYHSSKNFLYTAKSSDSHFHVSYAGGTHNYKGLGLVESVLGFERVLMALSDSQQQQMYTAVMDMYNGSVNRSNALIYWIRRLMDGKDATVNSTWGAAPGVGVKQVDERVRELQDAVNALSAAVSQPTQVTLSAEQLMTVVEAVKGTTADALGAAADSVRD